ncbi:carboxypeptidase-like regulatory domain-containing protein [Gaoshiqia sp. Z1-71]|uniref:carboxypeptidase-like regulatory domain-containing protein n=1 Tax=Gaoshiqia hydrogeniformans TaxID=3290090 RepID=UPI003BF892F1
MKTRQSLSILSLLLLSFIHLNLFSQKLPDSRRTSYYTYIYKLTDQEAKKIYRNDLAKVGSSCFHSLVDSFLTDSAYTGVLPKGHYLKTYAEKNKQKFSVTTVHDFDVFILNNQTDLCIQVYDLHGKIIPDAKVSVGLKKLHFDQTTQSHLDRKSNQKGLLSVKYNGFTSWYNLARQYNNSFIKRGAQKVAYHTPVKYVWLPVRYAIRLPIDGTRSIVEGGTRGTIYGTKRFFVRSFRKVASIFDDSYRDSYSDYKFERNHTGYIVFNKPKYHPGDSVKFKAFLLTKEGKPVDKPVNVILQTKKNVELTRLDPYRPGGYAWQFFLHDSLQLQLDRQYPIRLELNGRKKLRTGYFRYEDYELSKNKLSLRLDQTEQYRNEEVKLFVKGTDENDLNLLDARIEVLVKPKLINRYFEKQVFIPDTLLFLEKRLEPTGETELILPDSVFPKANLDYELVARLLTSDNEAISESRTVSYLYDSEEFDMELLTDSIRFGYKKNGVGRDKKVTISANDNFGNQTKIFEGTTPCKIELDPFFASYTIQSDSLINTVDISSQPSLFQCFSERTPDSVYIVADNPRKLPFSYTIYKRNSQRAAGYTDSLDFKQKTTSGQTYFVSVRYLWGGKMKEENYQVPLMDKKLNVSVIQPKVVYPGQKSRIEILVTDQDGKPVEGVDLTAFSLTKKFGYMLPELPYLGKSRKNKTLINNFHFEKFNPGAFTGLKLDYEAWKLLAGLDSIEYYQFIYPEDSIYRFEYHTGDSASQFAPFVVSEGDVVPVHVVEVDHKPVYFSWSTHIRPYSFEVDSGYHQISLRTSTKNITIDSLYFHPGRKLIFSLNEDVSLRNVRIQEAKPELSVSEQQRLYKYIFPYRNTFGERYAFLEQKEGVRFLKPSLAGNNRYHLAGPVAGPVAFHLMDSFSSGFDHEPFFEYEFAPELLKMRSADRSKYPIYLNQYQREQELTDVVLTKASLQKQWQDYLDSKRRMKARYRYPDSTSPGNGKMLVNLTKPDQQRKDMPLNMLVFRYDNPDFLRVYPGQVSFVHDLQEGYYKLIFFYTGAKYQQKDSLYVERNGLNYYEFDQPLTFNKDTFSLAVSQLIEETIFSPVPFFDDEEKELKTIYHSYQQQFQYTGDGDAVEGYVFDQDSGEPIPGVTVVVKGTTYGAITTLDGYYSLRVPRDRHELVFSFIGYDSVEKRIAGFGSVNVNLSASVMRLDEVVVVGYGMQRKMDLTGAVAGVSTVRMTRGIPGVSGNISLALNEKLGEVKFILGDASAGQPFEIMIRGTSVLTSEQPPLYLINGNVFSGNIAELDPGLIKNIQILKGADATAIYGARGANGVVIIETGPGTFRPTTVPADKGADFDDTFLEATSAASSIRDHFADDAFWKPNLTTDKNGKAGFEVTFPDDVTSWETFYLAMNGKRQSGQTQDRIKSYKPLMAQLAVPRFLVQSDTTFVIGKALNYMPDSVQITTRFEVNGQPGSSQTKYCAHFMLDTIPVIASLDSVSVKYFLEKEDGYFDGELRDIPVFPLGLDEAKGEFHLLDRDTTIQLSFDPAIAGEATLYARADVLDLIRAEIRHVLKYRYQCNEQLASKLKVLLAERAMAGYAREEFKQDKEIEKLIRLLNGTRKTSGLWGWWKDSEESDWISLHVLEALACAEEQGYAVKIDKEELVGRLTWELQSSRNFDRNIRMLNILKLLDTQINYQAYLSDLEKSRKLSLHELLRVMELKQQCELAFDPDTLNHYQKTTLFGNVYIEDKKQEPSLLVNEIQNTLLAYRILKADSAKNAVTLGKIRNYFLENRKNGFWQNTYESAQIIETILPDLLGGKNAPAKPELKIQGDVNQTVTEFPFEMKVDPTQQIQISKTGDFPVYLTSYQTYWNRNPQIIRGDFEITTYFDHDSTLSLKAGNEVSLVAKVKLTKDAEYVMINIPIPGGCSYADKKNNFRNESHREYFKNETTIFCERLRKGEYSFEIKLIPRYTGTYALNPAKVELMYFPVFRGNEEMKRMRICDK